MTEFSFERKSRKVDKKPICIIYGPAGVGKTTLAASAKDPVFLQTEDGAGELEIQTIKDGIFESYDEFIAGLIHIWKDSERIDTLVIDSLDHLETLVWQKICKFIPSMEDGKLLFKLRNPSWDTIETPGYGRGYIECDILWKDIISKVRKLRDQKNISVIMLAHDIIKMNNDPTVDPYDSHIIKLHKRATGLLQESCDLIGLIRTTVAVDMRTGKGKGGTEPTLFVRPNAAWTAKTRYGSMPQRIPIPEENGWDKVAQYIPALKQDS